jgi:signal transduction histidine kinase
MTEHVPPPSLVPSPLPPLSVDEREALRRGTGSRLPLGLVLLALVFAIALPRFTQRRITELRNEINEVAAPARQRVTQIQLDMALEASQRRGYLLSGDMRMMDHLADSRARRQRSERELIDYARHLDTNGSIDLARAAEKLRGLDLDLDSLVMVDAPHARSPVALGEQRRRFLIIQALADTLDRAIDRASESRRNAIGDTESIVAVLTGVSLLLGLGAAFMVGRLGSRFRGMALSLDASDKRSRQLAESERAARAVAERREQELERVTESRGRLLRGFTHDVKNPLGAADGYLALVEEGVYGDVADKARDIVTKTRRSIGQALELIGQLLEIARAEAGQLEIHRRLIDVPELVRDVAESFGTRAKAKNIGLAIDLPTSLPTIHTDGIRVRQIVANLVSNAVKYTHDGGHVSISARHSSDLDLKERSHVVIAVSDDGPGIPQDKLPMLFTEFTRFHAGAAEGAGIGLAISKKIADALDAQLTVECDGRAGCSFSLHLPVGDHGNEPSLGPR